MRFKANIHSPVTLHKFVSSLSTIGPVAWVRLDSDVVRFTIIPEQGSQVWAHSQVLASKHDTVFEDYTVQSAAPNNTVNLEVPLQPLLRALKSASNAASVSIRLTKKDGLPWLVLTIVTTAMARLQGGPHDPISRSRANEHQLNNDASPDPNNLPENTHIHNPNVDALQPRRERETHITLDVPVIVLAATQVAGLHEPHCREPDVHITLPPLAQVKSVSDRFARLAGASSSTTTTDPLARGRSTVKSARLDLAATMHGTLRLSYHSDALNISSSWRGLENPELDPAQVGGEEQLLEHPSTRMRAQIPDDDDDESAGWAKVRIDARDWSKVLSVGRIGGKVIACFCDKHALILYVYLPAVDEHGPNHGDESVLTYYITSYSI